jgi:hypothetical protein
MTLMIQEGVEAEIKYEKSKELTDPERLEADDEKALFRIINREIQSNPKRFR